MDTTDRSDSKLPAPFPMASSPSLLPRPVLNRDLTIVQAPPQIDSRVIIRGLARYWWRILLLWVVVSAPVAYLIYATVAPTYEAISRIRIEPTQVTLFEQMRGGFGPDPRSYEPYLQTQVNLMQSNQVLNKAIMKPSVANLPFIARSEDAKTDLREKMDVEIEPDTFMIKVSLESKNPAEAAEIVNAVVSSYLDENLTYTASRDTNLKTRLATALKSLKDEIERKKAELKDLHQKGTVQITKPPLNLSSSKPEDDETQVTIDRVGEQHINNMIARMVQIDLDLITAKAELKARLEAQKGQQDGQDLGDEFEDRVKEAFLNDPDVRTLSGKIQELKDEQERQKRRARRSNDPALLAALGELTKYEKEWNELWATKSEEFRKRLRMATNGRSSTDTIGELQYKIRVLEDQRAGCRKVYEQQKVEQKTTNDDSFQFAYAQQELTSLLSREEQVKRNLAQLEFQSRQEQYRVALVDPAEIPKIPSNNKRLKYMAAAPVGVLFVMLGLFLLHEIRAERVADPDALSTRVRSEVYALPPLPTSRALRRRSEVSGDDQIERFSQRLDHLRFAICGNSIRTGKGRCVLITSAIGGEGKTTLAAHLAARCGNAGMNTLLIDADLQKGALSRLLDVPDGLGLSDVLKGDSAIEDVVIPVQGGIFRLLSAGTPIRDNSTLLQDHRFGMFIAQLRQLYDLIIIDSPPVLPIPDALILGRWTDGAVLAARYDISRFPQVERARRQLDSAGVAVLGTVINGMRHSESYYGRYTYSRQRSSGTDSSNTS
jgi:polysaccharide biosynthesis transport protein